MYCAWLLRALLHCTITRCNSISQQLATRFFFHFSQQSQKLATAVAQCNTPPATRNDAIFLKCMRLSLWIPPNADPGALIASSPGFLGTNHYVVAEIALHGVTPHVLANQVTLSLSCSKYLFCSSSSLASWSATPDKCLLSGNLQHSVSVKRNDVILNMGNVTPKPSFMHKSSACPRAYHAWMYGAKSKISVPSYKTLRP